MNKEVNILICDDNPIKLDTIEAIIEEEGLKLVKASSGEEAIEKAKTISFALILLDINMPGMDGFETAHAIRNETSNVSTPIIFITAACKSEELKFHGYKSGAVDYLETPISPIILKSKVKVFVELFKKTLKIEQMLIKQEKFYSIIAHDLRSPMSPLVDFLEMMISDIDAFSKEEIKENLLLMKHNIQNVFQLLVDLLELTRLRSEDFVYVPTKVYSKNVVEDVFRLLKTKADEKNIVLKDNSDNLLLFADRVMLQTIIYNLLANAIKFTPSGGNISVGTLDKGDKVEIAVSDSGRGIEKENIDKLFRSDVRFTKPGTDGEAGTGLGLSVCKELTVKQNGEIFVESEIGKGTTFTISLPMFVK